eukprot:4790981-Amphidinium_carterae.1
MDSQYKLVLNVKKTAGVPQQSFAHVLFVLTCRANSQPLALLRLADDAVLGGFPSLVNDPSRTIMVTRELTR